MGLVAKSRAMVSEGGVFGRWTVLGAAFSGPGYEQMAVAQCSCGEVRAVACRNLISGKTKSCGCLKAERLAEKRRLEIGAANLNFRHGKSRGSRLYAIWHGMRSRCNDPSEPFYHGKGVAVCEEWGNFPAFEAWALANGYADDLSIDRIRSAEGYGPGNCRWANAKQQSRNTSRNVMVEIDGVAMCVYEAIERFGAAVHPSSVLARLRRGWGILDALKTPAR